MDKQLMAERRAFLQIVFAMSEDSSIPELAAKANLSNATVYRCWDIAHGKEHWEGRCSTIQKLGMAVGLVLTLEDGKARIRLAS